MDVRKIRATADLTIEIDADFPLTVTFTLKPLMPELAADAKSEKNSEILKQLALEAIVDWDLKNDGENIPCTEENKLKYLPDAIFRWKVKNENISVMMKIIEFAGNSKNFFAI